MNVRLGAVGPEDGLTFLPVYVGLGAVGPEDRTTFLPVNVRLGAVGPEYGADLLLIPGGVSRQPPRQWLLNISKVRVTNKAKKI